MIHESDGGAQAARGVLGFWTGHGGDGYTGRNVPTKQRLKALYGLWSDILGHLPPIVGAVEIGAGTGDNLAAMRSLMQGSQFGVEPNASARENLSEIAVAVEGSAESSGLPDRIADLAFTSACLIHVPPERLPFALREIHRLARKCIVCIEYFSHEPQEIVWRGQSGLLWKRDFGSFWLEQFPDLIPVASGFAAKPMTGLDNITWWAFRKPAQETP